jgi:hypothetical protein
MSRCYACDAPASVDDGPTGRCYCSQCWEVITDTIGRTNHDDDEKFLVTGEFDVEQGSQDTPDMSEV